MEFVNNFKWVNNAEYIKKIKEEGQGKGNSCEASKEDVAESNVTPETIVCEASALDLQAILTKAEVKGAGTPKDDPFDLEGLLNQYHALQAQYDENKDSMSYAEKMAALQEIENILKNILDNEGEIPQDIWNSVHTDYAATKLEAFEQMKYNYDNVSGDMTLEQKKAYWHEMNTCIDDINNYGQYNGDINHEINSSIISEYNDLLGIINIEITSGNLSDTELEQVCESYASIAQDEIDTMLSYYNSTVQSEASFEDKWAYLQAMHDIIDDISQHSNQYSITFNSEIESYLSDQLSNISNAQLGAIEDALSNHEFDLSTALDHMNEIQHNIQDYTQAHDGDLTNSNLNSLMAAYMEIENAKSGVVNTIFTDPPQQPNIPWYQTFMGYAENIYMLSDYAYISEHLGSIEQYSYFNSQITQIENILRELNRIKEFLMQQQTVGKSGTNTQAPGDPLGECIALIANYTNELAQARWYLGQTGVGIANAYTGPADY